MTLRCRGGKLPLVPTSGTLYRRYPDVASVALGALDEHERVLQKELVRGTLAQRVLAVERA